MSEQNDVSLEQEAERLTNETYLKVGYFGGKTTGVVKGAISGIRYFDHKGIKTKHLDKLKRDTKKV